MLTKQMVRAAVRIWIYKYISFPHRMFYSQGDFAEALGVRAATVSSWMNENSDIDFFTFLRICLVFAVDRNQRSGSSRKIAVQSNSPGERLKIVFLDFLSVLERQLSDEK